MWHSLAVIWRSNLDYVGAARVFQAIQGHWLTACLGVLMDLKIPEILTSQQQPVEFKQVTDLITQIQSCTPTMTLAHFRKAGV